MHLNLASTAQVVQSKTLGHIFRVDPQAPQTYAVVANIVSTPRQTIAHALEDILGSSFAVVPGTAIQYEGTGFVKASVQPRLESMPYDEAHIAQAKLHVVSANVFMDEADNAWTLEDGRLVKTTDTDYDALAKALTVRASASAPLAHKNTANAIAQDRAYAPGGSYAYFMAPDGRPDFGIVVAKAHPVTNQLTQGSFGDVNVGQLNVAIVSRARKALFSVPTAAVLEFAETAGDALPKVDFSTAPIEDYYAQLFGKDTPFYKALEDQIRAIFS